MPSTVIAHIQYLPATEVLRIAFNSGAIYDYLEVPESVYKDMKQYREKGVFLNKYIKGKYHFKKVTNG
ncbi:KTSC domain-containing protein [Paraflavitalea sp. CAU 1676]|uniref:KTSC domain-containing protein n=1 Tax=Paraflavitalea sp. CAU 1676 TaxID=3032598 RepID=UPI0023DAEDC8|nr:KTSC domain-containing protein [Paraflavitalea sp. CAU 1676]MDF2191278.1 KTSC domain-containing protein [Paraflavitalea sp. CAU 1676]